MFCTMIMEYTQYETQRSEVRIIIYLLSDCSGHFSSLVHLQGISRKKGGGVERVGGSIGMCVMLYLKDFSQ